MTLYCRIQQCYHYTPGQVRRATLLDGTRVVVKVQYPEVGDVLTSNERAGNVCNRTGVLQRGLPPGALVNLHHVGEVPGKEVDALFVPPETVSVFLYHKTRCGSF